MNAAISEFIAKLKCDTLAQARARSIPIVAGHETIGSLVPIGPWILSDDHHISLICTWRQRAMRMFLAQFESTMDRTRHYLKTRSIGETDRVLFFIHDHEDRCVGHGGFSGISQVSAELDNLMRGMSGGHPNLILHAERTLLNWLFDSFHTEEVIAKVLSYNWMVIDLHESLGFHRKKSTPLRKVVAEDMTLHEPTDEAHANVRYSCVEMALTQQALQLCDKD